MGRTYTAEQYERWFVRDCVRCGRRSSTVRWPDGQVCRTCQDRALRTQGRCPGCSHDRLLAGRRAEDRAPICTSCAGFSISYTCAECGQEGKLHAGRRCTRCTFTRRVAELLDDGTGRIRPELAPLAELLTSMDNPLTGLAWVSSRHGRPAPAADLLRGLGRADIELSHDAFHRLQPWRAAAHLRELLMQCGVLPPFDKQILLFERWLLEHMDTITDTEQRQLLRQYATWYLLPWLRRRAERGPVSRSTRGELGQQVLRAGDFLTGIQEQGLTLARLRQDDLDRWIVTHPPRQRQLLKPFLTWAAHAGHMPRLHVAAHRPGQRSPITQHRRIGLLRKLITDDTGELRARVAAILLLLYAQPLGRILRLTIDDIDTTGSDVLLRLGDPPTPVPAPVAELLLALRDQRTNMRTATNRNARWLFPGRRAGQPLTTRTIAPLIRDLGVPTIPGRTAPTCPPSPGTGHRPGPRLPPHHHPTPPRRRRRNLEPIRTNDS
ncbi:hypothetical protein EV385_5165 [Krasilnikovia cinnamomea]|uniref:Site-specific recombinase XerD n=1 Tax=Krasilnikovia cinnamomea TaxID=349313 RepID=A0A4Q7ZQ74_9ACTN|nr:hypothetical protein EV385_5165 [Krasilnikovia cinnamomea]